jgi:hypothetical protein
MHGHINVTIHGHMDVKKIYIRIKYTSQTTKITAVKFYFLTCYKYSPLIAVILDETRSCWEL